MGDYSIMDWVTLASVFASVVGIAGTFIKLWRDNKALSKEIASLSKEHDSLSKENQSLKRDTTYISDEMKYEKKSRQDLYKNTTYISNEMYYEKQAREDLYKNSSRAKEILETMDMMKEVVLQNANLNREISDLKVKNQALSQSSGQEMSNLVSVLRNIDPKAEMRKQYQKVLEKHRKAGENESLCKYIESIDFVTCFYL